MSMQTAARKLTHKIAIVTGAAKGIGLAVAQVQQKPQLLKAPSPPPTHTKCIASCSVQKSLMQALGNEGAAVMVSDVDDQAAEKALISLKEQGIQALYTRCDVSKKEQVQRLVQQTVEQLGGVDILVANAGKLAVEDSLYAVHMSKSCKQHQRPAGKQCD